MHVAREGRDTRGSDYATTLRRSHPGRRCSAIIDTARASGILSSTTGRAGTLPRRRRSTQRLFAIAVSVSWWAARVGKATLAVPRMPLPGCVGRREAWLSFDPRVLREWAMTPLALSLDAPCACFGGRLDTSKENGGVCQAGGWHYPSERRVWGQGHHTHRIPKTKWAAPMVAGHDCPFDEFLPRYPQHVRANLLDQLPELFGKILVVDSIPKALGIAPAPLVDASQVFHGQQAGALNQRAALPPLLSFGLSVDEHFEQASGRLRSPMPTEQAPVLDRDLVFAASYTAENRTNLRTLRQHAVGASGAGLVVIKRLPPCDGG
eukprot:s8919_g2.t1